MKKSILDPETTELLTDAGHNLRVLRQAKGLRIEDLAEKSGLSIKSIKNIEGGRDFMFSSLVAVVRVLKEGSALGMSALVPSIDVKTLADEFTYTRLAQTPKRRIRVTKGATT